ncbi:NAD(P)H-binding protein [Rhizobium cauense]|uniref:NAD(P)H-binding protein n=1 Tax=Rhizobium cauense TaxID=1166683 RepID=UPI001C6E6B73|nr:NAD(P)H-binding protein [Rhizobium cauense]MBW9113443.1 NAD(P)H-binding protein [Rhizobium cauense]
MSMPRYLVTGANSQRGQLAIAELARREHPEAVFAMVRDPAATSFPAGVDVRQGDYDSPETLDLPFAGIDRLLLISSSAVGGRVAQHRNVIEAAKRAGVSRIAYTSVLHADTSSLELAEEHRQTEALIAASGIPHTLLRNGWYTGLPQFLWLTNR